jgi:hypothetical protein
MSIAKKKKMPAKAKTVGKKANEAKSRAVVNITEVVQDQMTDFSQVEDIINTLSPAERKRLIGAGVRNYGFIDKAFDIANDNPQFVPSFLSIAELWNDMHDFEDVRQLVWVLEKFLQLANEAMLVRGDKILRDALFIYNNLRELSKARVPGAQPLFEALLKYFRRRTRPGEAEPTVKQLEKDFHALIHGTKDGKLVIENEKARTVGGKHLVVDRTRSNRNRGEIKETVEGEVE